MKQQKKKRKNWKDQPRRFIPNSLNHDTDPRKFHATCKICGYHLKSIIGLGAHLLQKHNGMFIEDYIEKYFTNLTPKFKHESCGFCNRNAKPTMSFDFRTEEYSLSYPDGYMCYDLECINNICLEFFGIPYPEAKKKFEHIGAKSEYLARKYKISQEVVKNEIKRNKDFVYGPETKSDLNGFILRHGKKKGIKLYNERCDKIRKSNTIEWYIEKFGIEDGIKKFQERFSSFIDSSKDINHSKNQYRIFEAFKVLDKNWEDERFEGGFAQVDMRNKKLKTIIEYFSDYWHCNPVIYSQDYYNKNLKCTAKEKQEFDIIRLNKILERSKDCNLIIVIWEKTFFTTYNQDVNKIVSDINKKIQYHLDKSQEKKEILWI